MRQKFRDFLIFTIVALISILLFYFKLLFLSTPFIEWGNFYFFPLAFQQLVHGSSFPFWNPYGGDGLPNLFISATLINYIMNNYPSILLGYFLPLSVASRVYILYTTLFLAESFYILSGRFTDKFFVRVVASLFFLYNAFEIDQLSSGDFAEFFSLAFLLLSLNFVILSRSIGKTINIYSLVSIILLFASLGIEEFTYLGSVLYLSFFIIYTPNLGKNVRSLKNIFKEILLPILLTIGVLLLIFTPFILPIEFGSFISLGPSSPYAQSLQTFKFYSNNFLSVLFLIPYPIDDVAQVSVLSLSSVLLQIWNLFNYLLLALALLWGFIRNNKRLSLFSVIIIVSALIGAGPKSIIPSVPIFFYLHLPGYKLLNTSYYWDWIIIAPLYSIIFIDIIAYFYESFRSRKTTDGIKWPKKVVLSPRKRKILTALFAVVFIFVLLTPVASQGYYNSSSIINRGSYVPQSYYNLNSEIDNLTSGTFQGVAFFPYDQELIYNLSIHHFLNPLYNSQSFRTPYMSTYASVPAPINDYFSFVYNEFYNNLTTHLSELMGIAGMDYFVVLKGVSEYNGPYNASETMSLMQRQIGVTMVSNTSTYSIYKSNYFPPVAKTLGMTGILLGNYYALNTLANKGIDLVNYSLFMPNDISQGNWKVILNSSRQIILQKPSDINQLYMLTTNSTKISSANYVSDSSINFSDSAWASSNSYNLPNISDNPTAPSSFAFTKGNSTLTIPLSIKDNQNEIWIQIWEANDSGNLTFFVNNNQIEAIHTINNGCSGFRLVNLNYSFTENNILRIISTVPNKHYINAVGNIILVNGANFNHSKYLVQSLISKDNVHLVSFNNLTSNDNQWNGSTASFTAVLGGFEVGLPSASNIVSVNYPYYKDILTNGKVLSLYGGVNQVLVSNVKSSSLTVKFASFEYWYYGTIIQIVVILAYLGSLEIKYLHKKKGGRP